VGDLVFTSGFGPHDVETGAFPEGVAAQTDRVLDHLEACLAERGLGLGDVVRVTAHLADLVDDLAAYNKVMERRFAPPYPVRTTVGSALSGFLVELDVVAAVSSEHTRERP
jgi:enamine deaminase RidA (YjgF/YER057c/UK114 family)